MTSIVIGLTADDRKLLTHQECELSASSACTLYRAKTAEDGLLTRSETILAQLPENTTVRLSAQGNNLVIAGLELPGANNIEKVIFKAKTANAHFFLQFPPFSNSSKRKRSYLGEIVVLADTSSCRIFVQCSTEEYLLGVLSSEMPAHYHLEAIKAQAITARTYALNPRVNHRQDHCHVCDSYLCCQCFLGFPSVKQGRYSQAIEETKNQVMIYDDKPILALFSACAGGHTENYQSCFSDQHTNAFPPKAIPYLTGVPEGRLPLAYGAHPSDKALATLWHCPAPATSDAWASQFKWLIKLPADSLEAHMHHVMEKMLNDAAFAPFVIPPPSAIFGEIKSFQILSRGVGGTAISLAINTSKGTWIIKKEIVIRNAFENQEIKLPKLRSARIYFEHQFQACSSLSTLTIYGLGSGHGVGLQQTGADGLARLGNKSCQEILNHYFKGAQIAQL